MAGKKANGAKRRHPVRRLFALLLCAFLVWCAVDASIVRLEVTDVTLADLPSAFDGLRVVFVSDLHIGAFNSVNRVTDLMRQLSVLEPDLILLGGDYADYDPLLLTRGSRQDSYIGQAERRDRFFGELAELPQPPLGIYAVAGERDNLLDERSGVSLEQAARLGGVTVLRDDAVELKRDGQTLVVAGVDDWKTGAQDVHALPETLSSEQCVLLVSHNPDALPALTTARRSGGRSWVDLALTGHLLGGRMKFFGHSLTNPSIYASRYLSGWYREAGAYLLISRGLGTPGLPLRFFSGPQVHLIILHAEE